MYAYFHKDYLSSCVGTTGLFQLARSEDCLGRKPDAILLFGNHDGTKDTVFYYDEENDIYIWFCNNGKTIEIVNEFALDTLKAINKQVEELGWNKENLND